MPRPVAGHFAPGQQSGFSVLDSNHSALYWRIALIDAATISLDIQTYLWYPDASGILLLEHALRELNAVSGCA